MDDAGQLRRAFSFERWPLGTGLCARRQTIRLAPGVNLAPNILRHLATTTVLGVTLVPIEALLERRMCRHRVSQMPALVQFMSTPVPFIRERLSLRREALAPAARGAVVRHGVGRRRQHLLGWTAQSESAHSAVAEGAHHQQPAPFRRDASRRAPPMPSAQGSAKIQLAVVCHHSDRGRVPIA